MRSQTLFEKSGHPNSSLTAFSSPFASFECEFNYVKQLDSNYGGLSKGGGTGAHPQNTVRIENGLVLEAGNRKKGNILSLPLFSISISKF